MQRVGERGKWLWNSSKENLIASICKQEMQLNRFSLKKNNSCHKNNFILCFKTINCIKKLLLLLYTSRNHDMVLLLEIKLFVMTFFSALWLPRERRFCFIGHCSFWDKGPGPHLPSGCLWWCHWFAWPVLSLDNHWSVQVFEPLYLNLQL